jgi:hypothetical protein
VTIVPESNTASLLGLGRAGLATLQRRHVNARYATPE